MNKKERKGNRTQKKMEGKLNRWEESTSRFLKFSLNRKLYILWKWGNTENMEERVKKRLHLHFPSINPSFWVEGKKKRMWSLVRDGLSASWKTRWLTAVTHNTQNLKHSNDLNPLKTDKPPNGKDGECSGTPRDVRMFQNGTCERESERIVTVASLQEETTKMPEHYKVRRSHFVLWLITKYENDYFNGLPLGF